MKHSMTLCCHGLEQAAQTAELRELHCLVSVSLHHLLPANQEPWTYKLIPLFPFDLLAGASQLMLLLLVSAWPHPSLLSQRLPIPAIHPTNSVAECIHWGTLSCIENKDTTGNVG